MEFPKVESKRSYYVIKSKAAQAGREQLRKARQSCMTANKDEQRLACYGKARQSAFSAFTGCRPCCQVCWATVKNSNTQIADRRMNVMPAQQQKRCCANNKIDFYQKKLMF